MRTIFFSGQYEIVLFVCGYTARGGSSGGCWISKACVSLPNCQNYPAEPKGVFLVKVRRRYASKYIDMIVLHLPLHLTLSSLSSFVLLLRGVSSDSIKLGVRLLLREQLTFHRHVESMLRIFSFPETEIIIIIIIIKIIVVGKFGYIRKEKWRMREWMIGRSLHENWTENCQISDEKSEWVNKGHLQITGFTFIAWFLQMPSSKRTPVSSVRRRRQTNSWCTAIHERRTLARCIRASSQIIMGIPSRGHLCHPYIYRQFDIPRYTHTYRRIP